MRIAQVAPLVESVPPKHYGGTERIVSYLTEELVRAGHEVTLFGSGDSVTNARLVSTQIYFFIQMNRITAPRVTPLSLRNIVRRGAPSVSFSGQRIQILQVAVISRAAVLGRAQYIPRLCSNGAH